jgi:hypothetical protein
MPVVLQNVTAKWLALLLRIREVPGSNVRTESGYRDFRGFFGPSAQILGWYLKINL